MGRKVFEERDLFFKCPYHPGEDLITLYYTEVEQTLFGKKYRWTINQKTCPQGFPIYIKAKGHHVEILLNLPSGQQVTPINGLVKTFLCSRFVYQSYIDNPIMAIPI
jgi:hypothetical protein